MSHPIKLGKHIQLKKVDRFMVMEYSRHENGVFTVLSPHTWKKLCLVVCNLAEKIKLVGHSRKFIRKLSHSMTLVVIVTPQKNIIAFLKTHNYPSGTRFDDTAWKNLEKICQRSIRGLMVTNRLGHQRQSGYRQNQVHQHQQTDVEPCVDDVVNLTSRLDNIGL